MRRRLGSDGFTLVELAVTVAVIGILASVAVPSIINTMPRIRLANATQTLANELAMLRMTAIAKSTDAEVVFDSAGDGYSLAKSVGGTPFSRTNLASAADLETLRYLDGVAAPNTLQLNASGTTNVPLQRQALLITLQSSDGTAKRRVLVWSSGRINSQKWAGGSTWVED